MLSQVHTRLKMCYLSVGKDIYILVFKEQIYLIVLYYSCFAKITNYLQDSLNYELLHLLTLPRGINTCGFLRGRSGLSFFAISILFLYDFSVCLRFFLPFMTVHLLKIFGANELNPRRYISTLSRF